MADANLAAITGALEQFIRERITRQPNRASVLLHLLPKEPGDGKNCAFDVTVGTALGSTIADGADVSTFNDDTELLATLPWGIYHDAYAITALAEAASNSSRTQLRRLWLKKTMDASGRVASKINIDLYSGNGTAPQMHGLTATAGPLLATGTYAGIDRGTHAQWASNVKGNGGVLRANTIDLMEQMMEDIYTASGEQPDLIVCSPKLHRKYASMFSPDRRYIDEITLRGQTVKLDGGYKALELNGVPIVKDKDCTANSFLFLNTSHTMVKFLPSGDENMRKAIAELPIAGTPEEQLGEVGAALMGRLRKLSVTGDKDKYAVYVWPQVAVDRCNAMGWLQDIS